MVHTPQVGHLGYLSWGHFSISLPPLGWDKGPVAESKHLSRAHPLGLRSESTLRALNNGRLGLSLWLLSHEGHGELPCNQLHSPALSPLLRLNEMFVSPQLTVI
ncbi:hypothetical protein E2C01_073089 [Portunus trituberculatus]|uniref:Uncharacterized protein n=1 Tax=Portunus trituberculatus TaxID=210409 RepID=A0A5B7ICF4_PORTR|nr:hypothetical protein [Portunus trituberculatus]